MVVFMEVLEKTIEKIKSQSLRDALAVQSSVLKSVSDFMSEKGVVQLLPVVVSPIDSTNKSIIVCEFV